MKAIFCCPEAVVANVFAEPKVVGHALSVVCIVFRVDVIDFVIPQIPGRYFWPAASCFRPQSHQRGLEKQNRRTGPVPVRGSPQICVNAAVLKDPLVEIADLLNDGHGNGYRGGGAAVGDADTQDIDVVRIAVVWVRVARRAQERQKPAVADTESSGVVAA